MRRGQRNARRSSVRPIPEAEVKRMLAEIFGPKQPGRVLSGYISEARLRPPTLAERLATEHLAK